MISLEVSPNVNALEVNIHSHLVPGKAVIARACEYFLYSKLFYSSIETSLYRLSQLNTAQ
jgi:hypothetical protein